MKAIIISGPLYAIYDKDNKALLTLTGGDGDSPLLRSIVADSNPAVATKRLNAIQRLCPQHLTLAKVEVNITEIL